MVTVTTCQPIADGERKREREIINKQTDMLDNHDRYLKIFETIQHQRHQGLFSKWSWFLFQCSHRYGKAERKTNCFSGYWFHVFIFNHRHWLVFSSITFDHFVVIKPPIRFILLLMLPIICHMMELHFPSRNHTWQWTFNAHGSFGDFPGHLGFPQVKELSFHIAVPERCRQEDVWDMVIRRVFWSIFGSWAKLIAGLEHWWNVWDNDG